MTYVRNAWYVASWSNELGTDAPAGVTILGEPIVLYRDQDTNVVALENRCVHRLAPLSHGRCEGSRLRCMYHGLLFDASGALVEIPGQDMIPARAGVKAYPVIERHSWVWVWMGDPAQADPALVPPAVGFDDPDYILGCGKLDYAAEARLICDNLLDFSHLTYVHANSFGAGDQWAQQRPRVTALDRGVRVERWMEAELSVRTQADQLYDRWQAYDFLVPGILLMTGGNFPLGTAQRLNFAPPDLTEALSGVTYTSQAVTPSGPGKSRYFFSWGPHVRHGDAAFRDTLMKIAAMAFDEDKIMIEAQQVIIDADPSKKPMPIQSDKGVTIYNRLIERLAREESQPAPQ